jgi:DNA-binding response OmpR family regulator
MRDWLPDDHSDAGRLLLVDDEPSIRTLAKWLLEQEGFQGAGAASSAEPLSVLLEVGLDL